MREIERLKRKTRPGPTGCMEWTGTTGSFGHGRMWFRGRLEGAHRVAWTLANGAVPEGQCVLHRCDNPRCVTVEHLFLGTKLDNTRDMDAKGRRRSLPGEQSPRAKLTAADVVEVRRLRGRVSQRLLAERFGVSKTAIRYAQTGRNWKSLPGVSQ